MLTCPNACRIAWGQYPQTRELMNMHKRMLGSDLFSASWHDLHPLDLH